MDANPESPPVLDVAQLLDQVIERVGAMAELEALEVADAADEVADALGKALEADRESH